LAAHCQYDNTHDLVGRKTSLIQLPAIHYFEAFIANTIHGRGECGSMTMSDMMILRSALYPNDPDARIYLGAFLLAHFRMVASQEKGIIVVGGLITHIAQCLNVDVSHDPIVEGETSINAIILKNMHFLTGCHLRYHFSIDNTRRDERIPFPELYNVQGRNEGRITLARIHHLELEASAAAQRAAEDEVEDHDGHPQYVQRAEFDNLVQEMGEIRTT